MITIRFKNKKGKNNYNNNEVALLRELFEQIWHYIMCEVCEDSLFQYSCKNCKYKNLCADIERVFSYLNFPNSSN